jgi:transcription-repair coupling factor (superfamily II helicase)
MTTVTFSLNQSPITPQDISTILVKLGYTRTDIVMEKGEFCIRGSIIDSFPVNHSHPIRIEIDLNIIDRMTSFDANTQRSLSKLSTTTITKFTADTKTAFPEFKPTDLPPIISEFKENQYVVHENFGIGQFKGLVRLIQNGYEGEYVFIQYKGQDKVYVPITHLGLLHHYSSEDGHPKLNGLNDGVWKRTKERAQRAVIMMVEEIYQLSKERLQKIGFEHKEDTEAQIEFENDFPFALTSDQLKAVQDIKKDMESPYPMDRLLCGDVGFGKTEVLLRAAFKAVENEKQVAILVPTTILADQHFKTFQKRFSNFPYRIELLSRFVDEDRQKKVIEDTKKHRVDIIIGTHRIIQEDIKFADLGLLVIDEEHRFGVAHKERLKQLTPNVDMITVSATPIPRTLYTALTGGRHISSIQTPPFKRKPIITYVTEYSDSILKEAISDEIKRKGKVFYLHNAVQTIYQKYHQLQALFPDLTITVVHGQMSKGQLKKSMDTFLSAEGQLLLCTTIIENGLDIPEANTIIIENAQDLGLSQIHQLRGRVGRTDLQGYAYMLIPPNLSISEDAMKRVKAVKEYTALGAGYKLAMKDLEIRGAGTLLGNAQSGHMTAVGFEMYCQLLEDAVQLAQDGKIKRQIPILREEFSAIPEDYIENPQQRLAIYQRLSKIKHFSQLTDIETELKDRYGDLPKTVIAILDTIERSL